MNGTNGTNGHNGLNGYHHDEHNTTIYMDYNATTPLESQVIESIANSLIDKWSNPSSQYEKSKYIKKSIQESRMNLATMINAESYNDIVFVSGGTEANNMVFYSVLNYFNNEIKQNTNQIPHFIISAIEHDSIKLMAEHFQNQGLAEVTEVEVSQHGAINVLDVIDSIKPNTILISIMLANNETGVIQPIKALTEKLKQIGYNKEHKKKRIFIHTDAAQAIGKILVDINELDVDYLTIVGHKFYGPRIGALYSRTSSNVPLYPIFFGGGQEKGIRPGTENTPMILGLGKAAELVVKNLSDYELNMKIIRDYLEERLEYVFGSENLHFNGRSIKTQRLPNTCNVSFISNENFKGYDILDKVKYLEASTGASCHSNEKRGSKILLKMGLTNLQASNAIRLSVGRSTTKDDVDLVVDDLKQALEKLL